MKIKRAPGNLKQSDSQTAKRMAQERYITITVICVIIIFVSAWSPYAVISMVSAFINPDASDGLYGTLPAIFAKRLIEKMKIF